MIKRLLALTALTLSTGKLLSAHAETVLKRYKPLSADSEAIDTRLPYLFVAQISHSVSFLPGLVAKKCPYLFLMYFCGVIFYKYKVNGK